MLIYVNVCLYMLIWNDIQWFMLIYVNISWCKKESGHWLKCLNCKSEIRNWTIARNASVTGTFQWRGYERSDALICIICVKHLTNIAFIKQNIWQISVCLPLVLLNLNATKSSNNKPVQKFCNFPKLSKLEFIKMSCTSRAKTCH